MTAADRAKAAEVCVHELKTWPSYFEAIADGRKTYELRRDDRGFAVGDVLRLREWSVGSGYTGNKVDRLVTHVLRDVPSFGLAEGYVLLSLSSLDLNARHVHYADGEIIFDPASGPCALPARLRGLVTGNSEEE